VLMTVSTTVIGLLPVMFGSATGSQVMKRIAAPMVGGLISSTILTLIIIPALYDMWKRWEMREVLSHGVRSDRKADDAGD
jgi:Cu(I)/Ag(I) efflux system membrane protein CusA/SilA